MRKVCARKGQASHLLIPTDTCPGVASAQTKSHGDHLTTLVNLTDLNLRETLVTDHGTPLALPLFLPHLVCFCVWFFGVADSAAAAAAAASLPATVCRVSRGELLSRADATPAPGSDRQRRRDAQLPRRDIGASCYHRTSPRRHRRDPVRVV